MPERAPEKHHQEIINDILKISLEPNQLKDQLEHILDYLISLQGFDFSQQAAIFLVEQDSDILNIKAAKGFSNEQVIACNSVRFGLCHCGRHCPEGQDPVFQRASHPLGRQLQTPHKGTTVFLSSEMMMP